MPLKLFNLIDQQAQQKFRTVSEETCFLLTEFMCGHLRSPRQSTLELFDTLMARSERKAKTSKKSLTVDQQEFNKPFNTLPTAKKLIVLATDNDKHEK